MNSFQKNHNYLKNLNADHRCVIYMLICKMTFIGFSRSCYCCCWRRWWCWCCCCCWCYSCCCFLFETLCCCLSIIRMLLKVRGVFISRFYRKTSLVFTGLCILFSFATGQSTHHATFYFITKIFKSLSCKMPKDGQLDPKVTIKYKLAEMCQIARNRSKGDTILILLVSCM